MRAYQPRASAKLSHEAEELLEEFLLWEMDRKPLAELNENEVFWENLKLAEPATAKRLVAHGLELCADRAELLPARLAAAAIAFLVKPAARNRIHDLEKLAKAAAYEADHPLASLREIGKAAGVHHTLIREWKRQLPYKAELVKYLIPHAECAYSRYKRRFGSPFGSMNLPEPDAFSLLQLRPRFAEAIARDLPITDPHILTDVLNPRSGR